MKVRDIFDALNAFAPVETALENIRIRNAGRDIHEADEQYLAHAVESAHMAAAYYGWRVVPCAEDGRMRSREAVEADIWENIADLV